ncbi:uncharacterized protein LOC115431040 [Sphaeramia orbicularis]|uniref:uncharacterized protein LOC115431040 n=1 Tax=Sphaeramia orbicularis TaxID=375764 RepID=UPI001180E58F|nr:uncharacterized protein LOC115431040 [Sphaeramia orbicularis]
MPQCCVPFCVNRSETSPELSFYRFPVDEENRNKWLQLIRRKDFIPNCNSRVCSWHFLSGKSDGPTRFVWNEAGVSNSPSTSGTRPKGPKRKNLDPSSLGMSTLKRADSAGLTRPADTIVKKTTPLPEAQNSVKRKNERLRNEVEDLKKQLNVQKQVFRFSQVEEDPGQVQHYTGLPDVATFHFLETLLTRSELEYHGGSGGNRLPLVDQLLMTLMKLKLNLSNLDLAKCFDCCTATVTVVVTTIIRGLYDILYVGMMEGNIPSRNKNALSLPACFAPFPNCRIVLDYTEVALEDTEKLDPQCPSDSQYKGKTTLKSLIGVAPNGVITFVSDLYRVGASDKAVTADCGILDHLQPGDLLLAEEGFTIQDIVPPGVSVNILSVPVKGQSTQEEVVKNQKIASARIHVKHSIQRLKLFSILDHISYQYETNVNKILKVCACLTNLQIPSLIEISTV